MNKLRKTRVLKEMNQFQLRIATGIHQSRISLIENGYVEPRDDEKKRLAKALKEPVETLFPTPAKGKSLLTERREEYGES
ncbi:MAG TPA: helix-turn-helix transcriptional regulator [Desulfatiglandales bacterium]|nr:helix-turn-helix transcriptional regulator [Desulfatiglandales bacterium]